MESASSASQQSVNCTLCKFLPDSKSVEVDSNGLNFDHFGFRIEIPRDAVSEKKTLTFQHGCVDSVTNLKIIESDHNNRESKGVVITPILQCLPSGFQLENGKLMTVILPHCIYPLRYNDYSLKTNPLSVQRDGTVTQFPIQNLNGDIQVKTSHFAGIFSVVPDTILPQTQKVVSVSLYHKFSEERYTVKLCLHDNVPHVREKMENQMKDEDVKLFHPSQTLPVKHGCVINVAVDLTPVDDCSVDPAQCSFTSTELYVPETWHSTDFNINWKNDANEARITFYIKEDEEEMKQIIKKIRRPQSIFL